MAQKDEFKPSASGKSLQGKLEKVLFRINKEGGFRASIISDLDGLSLASVASEFDDRRISAISAIVQDVSEKAEKHFDFKRMDEVSLVDDGKFRLVFRQFEVGGQQFILTAAVPPHTAYRKLTNAALKEISNILKEMRKI
ncbi:MAG: roadblock/LC7 domain-containing protein [Candidatus Aminicenantes bacterium]|nr:roadblock/LC7 domain-containing protein [Candidatus Aminicenantes bacterium]